MPLKPVPEGVAVLFSFCPVRVTRSPWVDHLDDKALAGGCISVSVPPGDLIVSLKEHGC